VVQNRQEKQKWSGRLKAIKSSRPSLNKGRNIPQELKGKSLKLQPSPWRQNLLFGKVVEEKKRDEF